MAKRVDLQGRTVVVTGASSGLGRGTAQKLAASGANVVMAARRGAVLDALAAEIAASGGSALAVETDVSRRADIARLAAAAVDRFGRIDVWINDVGIGAFGAFWEVPVEDHARVIDVNLTGLIYGAHEALRHFTARGEGVLINVGSVESELPIVYQSSYAASKAAVLSLGRCLNEELRIAGLGDSIRVGTIMPWALDTPFWVHAANYTGNAPRMSPMDGPEPVVDAIVAACVDPKEEQQVGVKAHVTDFSHRLFPELAERLATRVADRESQKGFDVAPTRGSIYEPMEEGTAVEGGTRDRMKREDAAHQ
jgi:short-subunit dehydrogenase